MNKSYHLYKVFYDKSSRDAIQPPFEGIDNSNEDAGWYEVKAILGFLGSSDLKLDAWYGFFSPRIHEKTGFSQDEIVRLIDRLGPESEIILLSSSWDELAFFRNPFEQGERWHPGLLDSAQEFLRSTGRDHNIQELVTDWRSSVFSTYIIAKPNFWRKWEKLMLDYTERVDRGEFPSHQEMTPYFRESTPEMKVFVAERLTSYVIATGNWKVQHADYTEFPSMVNFPDRAWVRWLLKWMNTAKSEYRNKRSIRSLRRYYVLRWLLTFALRVRRVLDPLRA